jgi:DNA (cytosine-5)-methyltransferase 1
VRFLELFAGAGGLSLGLEAAGLSCVAHAEVEPHARAVLRRHWPETALHGDVTAVNWAAYAGRVDLVAGGSPCQDLSVAGKRAGLAGKRSGLFHELVRAWTETRAPVLLWENVDGARSSNGGADFAAVLTALVGAAVAAPADGWRSGGLAVGDAGVAAWRVLDLQYFGPPQRRRRLFVVAVRHPHAARCDPAEVLALTESVCGHPAPREQARQDAAADAGGGASGGGVVRTLVVGGRDKGAGDSYDNTPTVVQPVAFAETQRGELRTSAVQSSLSVGGGKPGEGYPAVLQPLSFHLPKDPISGDVSPALGRTAAGMGVVGVDLAPTLNARDFKGPGSVQDGHLQATVFPTGRPRRLMPVECERLMGWPDGWTAEGVDEDGARYQLSDTPRYRLCGNGVGSPVAEWIGRRLAAAG